MSLKPDDLKMLISKHRTMNIEELKARIDHWEEIAECSKEIHNIDIAKKELERRYKERQEQLELLTQSLTSSSRVGRWISSIRAIIDQFVESNN
tara:strand:- start:137 stop:418 length:282 start_codon:yes stop_codon:yes gene_type:complete